MKEKYFTSKQRRKAKREHLRLKNKNPEVYEKGRMKLVNHLMKNLKNKAPKWGALKITFKKQ